MLRLQKKSRPLLTAPLSILVIALSACVGLPKQPEVHLYMHESDMALCSEVPGGKTCAPLAMAKTDDYLMFSPADFEKEMNYLDQLIRYIENNVQGIKPSDNFPGYQSTGITAHAEDLRKAKTYLEKLKNSFKEQDRMRQEVLNGAQPPPVAPIEFKTGEDNADQ